VSNGGSRPMHTKVNIFLWSGRTGGSTVTPACRPHLGRACGPAASSWEERSASLPPKPSLPVCLRLRRAMGRSPNSSPQERHGVLLTPGDPAARWHPLLLMSRGIPSATRIYCYQARRPTSSASTCSTASRACSGSTASRSGTRGDVSSRPEPSCANSAAAPGAPVRSQKPPRSSRSAGIEG
jgi:hypothetical protein